MLKRFHNFALVALVAVFAVACQSGNQDVREAARNNISGNQLAAENPTVQPATPQANVPAGPTTTMEFGETTFDFGTVQEGEVVSHTFSFTNSGNEALILSDAKGSCGCTVPTWPREPIAPGETGEIVVEFNSRGKVGPRNQKVTLTANTTPPQTFLTLSGTVNAAAGSQDAQIQLNN